MRSKKPYTNHPADATIIHPNGCGLDVPLGSTPKTSGVPPVGCSTNNSTMNRTPDKLPDPWLFDSEKLLRELDRCREIVLLIPAPTHETHFAINNAVDAIWNLSQQLRFLLLLHKDGQRRFASLHIPPEDTNAKELREQERVDILRKAGDMRPDYETALQQHDRRRRTKDHNNTATGKRTPTATTKQSAPARMKQKREVLISQAEKAIS